MNRNDKPVFNIELAGILMSKGFQCINQKRNRNKPNMFVYYFTPSAELQKTIDEWYARRSNGQTTQR